MQGPGEAGRGIDPGAERRQPPEHDVDLDLGALRSHAASRRADRPASPARSWPAPSRAVIISPSASRTVTPPSYGSSPLTSAPVRSSAPGRRRRGLQRRRHRAHAADRHLPLAGAVADHVVEEAAVLRELRCVGAGEGADQGVGEQDAADGVVADRTLDQLADRPLAPGRSTARRRRRRGRPRPGAGGRSGSVPPRWRTGAARPPAPGTPRTPPAPARPRRSPGRLARPSFHQQAAVAHRGVRGDPPGPQLEVQLRGRR